MFYRPTWAEVNLGNIKHNIEAIRSVLSQKTAILAVVKADAYGHGIVAVSKKLVSLGINYLGVASIDEAIILRSAGVNCDILILGGVFPQDSKVVLQYGLTQTVYSLEVALALNASARRLKKIAKIHIKVDTGMGRLGIWHTEAFNFIREVKKLRFIDVEGIFTHLSSADTDSDFTDTQIASFSGLIEKLGKAGISVKLRHAANSLGVVDFQHSHFNLVRPGIVIYGLTPRDNISIKVKPVLSLKTKIISIKPMPVGRSIGYNRSFITRKKTLIAALPIGYGDGYPRALSNKASVLIGGKKAKIIGRVCMDYTMVNLSGIPNAKVGQTVTLIGKDGNNIIRAEDLADLSGTICYEIACGIGKRVPRVYIGA